MDIPGPVVPSSGDLELENEPEIEVHDTSDNDAETIPLLSDEVRQQLATVLPTSIFTVKGRQYVKTADLASFAKNKKSSKVWEHGFEAIETNSHKRYWFCQKCMFQVFAFWDYVELIHW